MERRIRKVHIISFSEAFCSLRLRLRLSLSHVGERTFKSWPELEKLSPKGKLDVLAEKLDVAVNYGELPWQVVPELIGMRNKVAHGKNELLRDERMLTLDNYDEKMGEILRAPWQDYATEANAERARVQVEAICRAIWAKAEFPEHELFRSGMQSGSARFISGE